MAKHTEKAFEDAIEDDLVKQRGWLKGKATDFDRELALTPNDLLAFIEETQADLWGQLRAQHKDNLESAVISQIVKDLESRGTLDVVRHGFKFYGKKIDVACFRPAHALNPELQANYKKNRLVVTRQVKFIPDKEDSIDLLLSLNGIPIATVELKNHLTGQTMDDAIRQYIQDRDPKHKLFHFKKRALVHFAVGPGLVSMTTRLAKNDTYFLPFNRGCEGGAGNPPHPSGYKTGYLWQEVWERHSFLDILGRFMHLQVEERIVGGKKNKTETMIFPRYHQLDVVRKLEGAAVHGAGKSYLVQHSAGSGKSNSIAWLAHRLSCLHNGQNERVFDSVVVVTDRRVLDQQLQDTIYQFEHKQGVVDRIDKHSDQLAAALTKGTHIIITTLQKFPFVTSKIGDLPDRKYAVIVDEAHSSQTGTAAQKMKEVLSAATLEDAESQEAEEETTYEDEIVKVMAARGPQANLSFFGFTATPKAKTLEVFGQPGPDGKPVPFHLYSMRQAIEEGFILDVLQNYTTYKTFYRLSKAIQDDPELDKKKATKAIARFVSLHPHNLAQKTEVMVEHFRQSVRPKIGGKAKAMVVSRSRLHAVRYMESFQKYIKEHGYNDIGVLVAFSGTVKDDTGKEYTEVGMNKGIKQQELPERFDTDEYQLLLVADKYQTGFDQPLLHTMYVDKKLAGVKAVQTLSRLNRTHPGKKETFILDFANSADEIQESFQPYYEETTVAEKADPQQLYDLQHKLNGAQVYFLSEVEAFSKVFFKPKAKQSKTDHAEMYKALDPAASRFASLEEADQEDFKKSLRSFVRLYAFLAQVLPYTDADLEKLYTFGRFLLIKLPRDDRVDPLNLDGDVALKYYRLEKQFDGKLALIVGERGEVYGPSEVGTGDKKDAKAHLSEIIDVLNERFGTEFTKADELFFQQVKEQAKADEDVVQKAHANPFENFALALRSKLTDLMVDRMDQNAEIVSKYLNEAEFQELAFKILARRIYDEVREQDSED